MSILITFNGANYTIPSPNEVGWGSNLDAYFVAIAAGALQKTGGTFTLSADTDFGASFGLKSLYYKSRNSNIASTGIIRLNNNSDAISWRNFANGADLPLLVNASDQLTFNGTPLTTNSFTADRAIISNGSGILTVSPVTSTELGYVSGVTSAIQTQLNTKATDSLVVHLAGTETITGAKTFSSAVTINPTTNQLILGLTNTITLNAAAPSTSRTWTIPDVSSNGTFVALEGTQTFTGFKTFNNDIVLSATRIAHFTADSGGNQVGIKGPATATSWNLQLPPDSGTSGYILSTDGTGITTWIASSGSGTVNTGTAGRLPIYNTSTNSVQDTYVQNTKTISVAIATQATRSANLTVTIPNPGDAVTATDFLLTEGQQDIVGVKRFADQTLEILEPGGPSAIVISVASLGTSHTFTLPETGVNADFVMTQGTQTIAGSAKIFESGILTVKETGGGSDTVAFVTPSLAASRSYTLPDAGANASFVMTEGTQTINGAKTFGADVALGSHKITGLANGTASTDAAAFGQIYTGFQAPVHFSTTTDTTQTANTFIASNLTASMTLTNSAHRVLIMANVTLRHNTANDSVSVALFRDTTNLDDATNGQGTFNSSNANDKGVITLLAVASPGDTSAHSYTVYFKNDQAAGTAHCVDSRTAHITLMEIV